MFGTKDKSPTPSITVWEEAPHFPSWAHPSVYYNGEDVLVCFESMKDDQYSVVFFEGVIEYIIQPFTDESLGNHEYCKYGLKQYEFNIVNDSPKLKHWKALKPKHWVITFKDETHDFLSKECKTLEINFKASSKLAAINKALESHGIKDT